MFVPSWSNQDVYLFHGTTLPSARRIVASGVEVNRSRPDCDFGTGFYCTTVIQLARTRAIEKAAMKEEVPAIVEFAVPRLELATLASVSFVRGERDATDFWSLVHFFRNGEALAPGVDLAALFPFDIAFGPIALWKTQRPMPRSDQMSFHSLAAQELLNLRSSRRILSI